MPPTSELNATGQFFEAEFKRAWALFDEEKFDEANPLARRLLMEPFIGKLHRAGLHLLLAHAPEDYLYHAQQAVHHYETLYEGRKHQRTRRQKDSQYTLLKAAKVTLKDAEKYAEEYSIPPTDEEIDEETKQAIEDIGKEELEVEDEANLEVVAKHKPAMESKE